MDAILGLRVMGDGDKMRREGRVGVGKKQAGVNEKAGEEVDTERAGNGGDRGYGRSQLIHMPDVTITLLI